jgi:hypothetical protein
MALGRFFRRLSRGLGRERERVDVMPALDEVDGASQGIKVP